MSEDPMDALRFPESSRGVAIPEPEALTTQKLSVLEEFLKKENQILKQQIQDSNAVIRVAKQIVKTLETVVTKNGDAVVLVKIGDGQLATKPFSNPEDVTRVIDYRYVMKLLDHTAEFIVPQADGFYQDNLGNLYEYREGKWIDKEPASLNDLEYLE